MKIRNAAAVAAIPAVAVGVLTVVTPAASAAPVTKTVSFQHQCRVDGASDWDYTVSDNLEVTAPAAVRPGEQFSVRLHPGQMRTSDSDTGRLKYDVAVPQGADLISYALVDGTASNLIGEQPVVLRVGADGNQNAAGEYLRITGTGNKTVNDGPSGNDNKPKEGLQVKANTDFRLPAVELTLKAGSGEDSTVTTRVRAGAATPVIKIKDTSLSFGESRWVNAAAYCVATGEGRNALSSTEVFTVAQTDTVVNVALEALTGDNVSIKATVAPNPGAGTVEFFDGENRIGSSAVSADGVAEMVWPFRDAGTHPITAKFTGTKKFNTSTSPEKTVTVTVPGEVVVEPTDPKPPIPDPGTSTGSLGSLLPGLSTGSLGGK
ncbi:Ig-like domain-containing protein [Rhodococcus sp. NPDC059234]|uniref:Ig-like domain-containing protein n=1 Tax=Rhodococcus sp. NPDC059234 TaxID=3346781 RepID=UPI003670774A